MAQKIIKLAQQSFDVISKDASVMNTFRKDHNSSKVWSHNKKQANFFENLLLKNKVSEKYSRVQECQNNIFFSLKSLLDKNLKQKQIQKQVIIEKVTRILKDVTQCLYHSENIKALLEKEKPFSDEDRKSLVNSKDYISKLSGNLNIVKENLNTIVQKWDDLVGGYLYVQARLTKIIENAQDLSKEIVGYAHKTKNINQNSLYSFSLDQNYSQLKKTNEEVIKNTTKIKTVKYPASKEEIMTYVDSTYLLIVFNSEAIIKVKESFNNYINKNTCYNLKAAQQHINSLKKYITDIQTQLQSINKFYLGRQLPLKQKLSQKPPQTKPPTSPIQTPTKNPSSQSITSPPMQKSQSQSYSPHLVSSPKQGLSGSQVSGDNQSRFSDIGSEKSNKSGVKSSMIQQQKDQSPLAQLIRLVSQNDETLAIIIPKSQHQPPAFASINVNHREMLSIQQKNNKAVQIAIDLFEKHQHDPKQNMPNSSIAEKGNQKEQNANEVDDTAVNLEAFFSKQDLENAKKQAEEKVRKQLEGKHKQAVDMLNTRINKLTVQSSGQEETHHRVVAGLKGEIDKINLQLESKLNELQIQRDMQTQLSSELDKIKVQNNKLKQTTKALQVSNKQSLQTVNKQLNDKNNQIQQHLKLQQQTKTRHEQCVAELNRQRNSLKSQISGLSEQKLQLSQKIKLLERQHEEANKSINQKAPLTQTQPQAPSTQLNKAPQSTEIISHGMTQVSQSIQITKTKMVQPQDNQPQVQDEECGRFDTQQNQGKDDSEQQKNKQHKPIELSGKQNDNVQDQGVINQDELKTSVHKQKQEQTKQKNLGQELEALQKQISDKTAQRNQLKVEIQNLTTTKFTVQRIKNLIALKEKQLQQQEQQLTFKRKQMQDAAKYVQLHNAEIAQKQQKAQQLKNQLQKLQQTHKSTIQKQQQQKTTLNQQLSQLQSKLQTTRNQLTSVQDQMNNSKELLANINVQKQTEAIMKKQLETLEGQVNEKKQQLDGLNNEATQKQLALSELEKKLSQTKREQDKVNSEITLLNQRVRSKKEQIETWQKLALQTKQGNEQKQQQQSKLNDELANLQNQSAAKNKDILELQSSVSEYEKKLAQFKILQTTNAQKVKAIEAEINLKQQNLKETRMTIINMISSINIAKLREDIQKIKKSYNQLKSTQKKTTIDQEKLSLASFSKTLQTAGQKLSFFLQLKQKGRKTSKNSNQNSQHGETVEDWSQQDLKKYVQLFEDKLKAEFQLVVQELKVKMLETNQHESNYQSLLNDADNQSKRLKGYKQQITKLQQTKQQRIEQTNQLNKTKQQVQNQLTALKQQYQSYIISQFGRIKQTSDYQASINDKNKQIQDLKNKIDQLNNTINQKDSKANQLSGRLSSLNQTIAQLKSSHEEALKKVTAELAKTTQQALQKLSTQFRKNIQLQDLLKSQEKTYQTKITQLQKELKELKQSMEEDLKQSKIQIGQGEAGKFAQEVQRFGANKVKQVQDLQRIYEQRAADMQSQLQTFKQNLHDDFNTKRTQYQKQVTIKVNTIIAQFNKTNASISQQRRKYHDLCKQTVKKEQYLAFFLKKIYCAFIYYNKVDQNMLNQEEKLILAQNSELKEQQARNVLKYALETISRVQQEKQVGNRSLIEARQKVKNYQEQYEELNNKIAELEAFIEKLTKSEQFQKSLEHLSEQGSSQKQKEKPIDRLRQSFIGFAQRADKYMNEFTTNNNEKCQNYINKKLEQKQIETTKVMSLKQQEIQEVRTKIKQHQIKLQKLNQDLVQAENTVIKNREAFEIQRTNLLRENQRITNQLQQTVNKNSVQFIQLRKEKQDLEAKCNLLNDECNNLQGQVASLEDSTGKLQRQVSSLKLKIEQLQESSKKQHLGITTQNNKLMQELQTKQSELNSFKQQVERKNTEIQSLKDQLARQKTNSVNASKTNSTLNQVQTQLNKSLQKIKDLEASKIALDNEWKQKLQTEKDNTQHWMTQTTRKQSQLHSLNQIFGEISKTLAIKMRVNRQFTPDTLVQAIDSYSPPVGKVLITSTIMLGLDSIRPQIIAACQKFANKTLSKSTVLFRYPDSKNMVSVLASKEFVSSPFIILYKTTTGWVVGSYSEGMKKPTFFFSFGSEEFQNRFEKEEVKKLKIHMPETSPEISAIEFVNARFLQYGNGEFKVSAIDLSSGTANSDVVSNRYYGFDWKNLFRDKNESKIMLSEVEVHRIDFA